jgi:hypothetical protein
MRIFYSKTACLIFLSFICIQGITGQNSSNSFNDPPREFSVLPFWFWNDTLSEKEIIRQIADFDAHGVYGFVIHPRIGLPENIKWLSPEMISYIRVAIEEASRRKMSVILYDEGMYPSGSSSGQVAEKNPSHAVHGLAKINLKPGEEPFIPAEAKLVTVNTRSDGNRVAIIEKPAGSVIRGLHYIGEGSGRLREETPVAGDILNPDAVSSFMDLVYEKYFKEFGKYFGNTIIGIFTDEPNTLGRGGARGIIQGNANLIPLINKKTGYDITPFLSDLWYKDTPEAVKHSADYNRAVSLCLEEIYYKRLSDWCQKHGVALMGHPAGSMDIGTEKFFQVPGQDLVWRYVEPGPKALEGQHSTMAKCASSAMLHLGYRRNSNELYGAYGHNFTWDEMLWLANWCFVRGQNMMIPHAFYYSIRGPRFDERPPDVGPNSAWWGKYKEYADADRRMSWINTDSKQVCSVAILADPAFLPFRAAKELYQNQIDFNYLESRHLWENAKITEKGLSINGMTYSSLIVDSLFDLPDNVIPVLQQFALTGKLIITGNKGLASRISKSVFIPEPSGIIAELRFLPPDLPLTIPAEGIRIRHVIKGGEHYYMIFNESNEVIKTGFRSVVLDGRMEWLNQFTGSVADANKDFKKGSLITFGPYEMKILRIIFK